VIGISAVPLDIDVFIVAAVAPITITKPFAIPTTFSYLIRVNQDDFNPFNSTKTIHN